MLKPFSGTRRGTGAALLCAMLSACAAGSARPTKPLPPPDPVVEVRTVTRRVCPAELALPAEAAPAPAAGAEVRDNSAGGDWIESLIAWGALGWARLGGAAEACAAEDRP